MSIWVWLAVALAVVVALWALLVFGLLVFGRRASAREVAHFVPDSIVLFKRLLRDSRVPRRAKIALALTVFYPAVPFDLIPDFIPVLGQIDDVVLVAAMLRYVMRSAGRDVVAELWPGSDHGLKVMLALS